MSQPVTAQQAAERARAYVTAAGAEVREDDLLTAAERAVCEVMNLCGGTFAPDSLLEETGALAAGYYLLFPGASSAGAAPGTLSPRKASTLAMPLRFRSSMACEMDSSVAPRHVRCATVGISKSSWIMAATSAVACLLPLPPAEYVTLTKSGTKSASWAATS